MQINILVFSFMILVLDRLDFSVVEAACLNITFVLSHLENFLLFSL